MFFAPGGYYELRTFHESTENHRGGSKSAKDAKDNNQVTPTRLKKSGTPGKTPVATGTAAVTPTHESKQ
jgi:hypothetical protein